MAIIAFIGVLFWRLPRSATTEDTIRRMYGSLVEVDAIVRKEYVHPVEDDRLLEGAIQGLLRRLDPYSSFIGPDQADMLHRRTTGEYVGIGVELGFGPRGWMIIAPVVGGPAARAGVRPDDVLIAVDDFDVDRLSLEGLENLLHGEPNSEVRLTLQSPGEDQSRTLHIRRDVVQLPSVLIADEALSAPDIQRLADGPNIIAYLALTHFHQQTPAQFAAALDGVLADRPRALIIDVRSNPGGLMDAAIDVLNQLIDSGPLLSVIDRRGVVDRFEAKGGAKAAELPLVVLVDRHTASSSEIVAGVLQARGRATIIGQRTFGKGSVQHVLPLADGRSAVKLTVAYYCLPNGRIIHRTRANETTKTWGVLPDIEVASDGGRTRGTEDPVLDAAIRHIRSAAALRPR